MTTDLLAGVWTYRSFLNNPEPVDDLNVLLFGQGEMAFDVAAAPGTVRGQLAFRSSPPKKDDHRLTLTGAVHQSNPYSVRFQGVGVKGTRAEGWIYDYTGYVVPTWPDGKGQRPALVGSVIRTAPHNGRPAGLVSSFVSVQRDFVEPRDVIPLPNNVLTALASRHHRLHHMVWHSTRNLWLTQDVTEEQREQIRRLGWQPGGRQERPALGPTGPLIRNGSGEDFLFMHRQMIAEVNALMGGQPIRGWTTIPAPGAFVEEPNFDAPNPILKRPGNPDGFTVPPTWQSASEVTNRRIAYLKTDDFYWSRMRWWDREFKNPQYLSTLTLGELGALLEWSVHNDMHMRWSSIPRDPQTDAPIPEGRPDWDISETWDNPKYDFLGEFYSSHVHPVFWRLHGWIDNRIDDWFAAHEATHPGEVQRQTVQGVSWFKKGRWVHTDEPWAGPIEHHHGDGEHAEPPAHDIGKMEKVVAILFPPPTAEDAAARVRPVGQDATRPRRTWF